MVQPNTSFFADNMWGAFAPQNCILSTKILTPFDILSTLRLNKSLTNNFVNLIALRKAKIVCNFGLSECNRVKLTIL